MQGLLFETRVGRGKRLLDGRVPLLGWCILEVFWMAMCVRGRGLRCSGLFLLMGVILCVGGAMVRGFRRDFHGLFGCRLFWFLLI